MKEAAPLSQAELSSLHPKTRDILTAKSADDIVDLMQEHANQYPGRTVLTMHIEPEGVTFTEVSSSGAIIVYGQMHTEII